MPKKRNRNTLNEDLIGLGSSSLIIGTGSMMMGVPGLNAPAGLKQAFPVAASFMPIASIGMMGKHLINMTKKIKRY